MRLNRAFVGGVIAIAAVIVAGIFIPLSALVPVYITCGAILILLIVWETLGRMFVIDYSEVLCSSSAEATGQITAIWGSKSGFGFERTIHYVFLDSRGNPVIGRHTWTSAAPIEVGSLILIRYDKNTPRINAPSDSMYVITPLPDNEAISSQLSHHWPKEGGTTPWWAYPVIVLLLLPLAGLAYRAYVAILQLGAAFDGSIGQIYAMVVIGGGGLFLIWYIVGVCCSFIHDEKRRRQESEQQSRKP